MMIHEVTEKAGKWKKRTRVGRGPGSGKGKTCGRGHKGAGSRAGHSHRAGHEGGQMPLFRRMAKRGFSNVNFKTQFHIVNIKALEARFEDGATVDSDALIKVGLIRNDKLPVKILGQGDLTKKLNITAHKFSESAKEKITGKGGSVVELGLKPQKKTEAVSETQEA